MNLVATGDVTSKEGSVVLHFLKNPSTDFAGFGSSFRFTVGRQAMTYQLGMCWEQQETRFTHVI